VTASEQGHRDLLAAIGKAIRLRRVERDMKRAELAERAGLSYAYVSEIENGTKQASSKALWGLARALGLQPHELMASAARMETPDRAPMEAQAPPDPLAGAGAGEARRATWFHLAPSAASATYASSAGAPAAARPDDPGGPADSAGPPGLPDLLHRLADVLEGVPDERAELALVLALDERRTRRIVREELDRRRPSG
jgi:transcriptional regulator with XRE-family HTH domain